MNAQVFDPRALDVPVTNRYTATYSPEDNKLRLYASHRLTDEIYARVHVAGFSWAPKQKLFVAPKWTPEREDALLDLGIEIGDEDTSLVDRAEERAERFEDYSEKRAEDANRAHEAVSAIAGNVPMGQPILVGHHSQRRAERDKERIDNGMKKAVNMWETSKYWTSRAKGAIRHAKYKERADVRARRIGTIEAEKRKKEREQSHAADGLKLWSKEGLTLKQAQFIAGYTPFGFPVLTQGIHTWRASCVLRSDSERQPNCPSWTVEQVQAKANEFYPPIISECDRWIAHCENRLLYEKAMLEEQGASQLIAPKPRPKQLPLCNYRAPKGLDLPAMYERGKLDHYEQVEMTKAKYAEIGSEYAGTRIFGHSHRVRVAILGPGAKSRRVCVFLTDSKVHEPPEAKEPSPRELPPIAATRVYIAPEPTVFDAMREQLRNGGVKAVSAPQLFATPAPLADAMVQDIKPGMRVLEPSAGTGRILAAIRKLPLQPSRVTAIEVCRDFTHLVSMADEVHLANFLSFAPEQLGSFDRIVMNPPFANGADVEHVTHALKFLKPLGRLKAIMSNGVTFRQDKRTREFRALVERHGGTIEPLPQDTFAESGTHAYTVLVTIDV